MGRPYLCIFVQSIRTNISFAKHLRWGTFGQKDPCVYRLYVSDREPPEVFKQGKNDISDLPSRKLPLQRNLGKDLSTKTADSYSYLKIYANVKLWTTPGKKN